MILTAQIRQNRIVNTRFVDILSRDCLNIVPLAQNCKIWAMNCTIIAAPSIITGIAGTVFGQRKRLTIGLKIRTRTIRFVKRVYGAAPRQRAWRFWLAILVNREEYIDVFREKANS